MQDPGGYDRVGARAAPKYLHRRKCVHSYAIPALYVCVCVCACVRMCVCVCAMYLIDTPAQIVTWHGRREGDSLINAPSFDSPCPLGGYVAQLREDNFAQKRDQLGHHSIGRLFKF